MTDVNTQGVLPEELENRWEPVPYYDQGLSWYEPSQEHDAEEEDRWVTGADVVESAVGSDSEADEYPWQLQTVPPEEYDDWDPYSDPE